MTGRHRAEPSGGDDLAPARVDPHPGFEEIHILWISEGMSCDGDTIAVTAADKPSIEDVVLGVIPGLPTVHLHNRLLSPSMGGEEYQIGRASCRERVSV